MREKLPDQRGLTITRRKLLVAGGLAGVVGAGFLVANRRQVARWVAGRTGSQNRDLYWLDPAKHDMGEVKWQDYPGDPNAIGPIHRTWQTVGRFIVDKEVYDSQVTALRDAGSAPRQAFSFRNGQSGRVGIAYQGDNPNFFGQTEDGSHYLVAAKISSDGLGGVLGIYTDRGDRFTAVKTHSLPAISLAQFASEHPSGVWV